MAPQWPNGKGPPELHELESEVMDEVWRLGETRVRPVLNAINDRSDRARAYTTIMTILCRLQEKGMLTRRRRGKGDLYAAALTREEYAHARAEAQVGALVDEWGDVALVHFAKEMGRLDARRRQQLQRLARRA